MEQVTLKPDGAGDQTDGTGGGVAAMGNCDTDGLSWPSAVPETYYHCWQFEDFGTGGVNVSSIEKIVITSAENAAVLVTGYFSHYVRLNGTNYYTATWSTPDNIKTFTSHTWTTNPATGQAWQQSEIDGAQFGIRFYRTSRTYWVKSYCLSAVVHYVEPNAVTKAIGKTITEAVNLVEATISRTVGIVRAFTEIIKLTETVAKEYVQHYFYKTLTETIQLAEAVTKALVKAPFTEVIKLTGTVTKASTLTRLMTETITLTEAAISKATTKVLTEILQLTDTFSKLLQAVRTLTETITLTDSASRAFEKALTEVIALSDSVSKSLAKTFSEVMSLTDSIVLDLLRARDLTVKVFTAQYRKVAVFTGQYRKIVAFTAQYRKLVVFTAQYRKIKTLTGYFRKLKIFTHGGSK